MQKIQDNTMCEICGKEKAALSLKSKLSGARYSACIDCAKRGLEPYKLVINYLAYAFMDSNKPSDAAKRKVNFIIDALKVPHQQGIEDVHKAMERISKIRSSKHVHQLDAQN